MRIGVVSDTHMPRRGEVLPPVLIRSFKNCDLIVHLGDWTSIEAYEQLAALAPVEGVAGNNDPDEIVRRFGYHKILTFGSVKFGLTHGHQPIGRGSAKENALRIFAGKPLDVILFGHSHVPLKQRSEGKLLFNPGSPTDKRRQPKYSFGLIDIGPQEITAKHIYMVSKK